MPDPGVPGGDRGSEGVGHEVQTSALQISDAWPRINLLRRDVDLTLHWTPREQNLAGKFLERLGIIADRKPHWRRER